MSEKELQEKICEKCKNSLIEKENMFYWRGKYFNGLVCEGCKSLWDINYAFMKYALEIEE